MFRNWHKKYLNISLLANYLHAKDFFIEELTNGLLSTLRKEL